MTRNIITAALVAAALSAPAAIAMPTEPLGPITGGTSIQSQDLRSPDAREPMSQWHQPADTKFVAQDLRTPDAVDGTGTSTAPAVTVVEVDKPVLTSKFDWEDAGLGAAIAAALGLVALGSAHAVSKHRTVPIG